MKSEELDSISKLYEKINLWNQRETFMLGVITCESPIIDGGKYGYERGRFAEVVDDLPENIKIKIINIVMKSVVDTKNSLEKEFENL